MENDVHEIELTHAGDDSAFDARLLESAVRKVLEGERVPQARISLAIVDDPTIHDLNVRFLNHDYPTDVLSFPLSEPGSQLVEGEIVVSLDTATRCAGQYSCSVQNELCLYCVHGILHLVGFGDGDLEEQRIMREKERLYLQAVGIVMDPRQDPKQGDASL